MGLIHDEITNNTKKRRRNKETKHHRKPKLETRIRDEGGSLHLDVEIWNP